MNASGGRALDGLGGLTVLPNPTKLRIPESNMRESKCSTLDIKFETGAAYFSSSARLP